MSAFESTYSAQEAVDTQPTSLSSISLLNDWSNQKSEQNTNLSKNQLVQDGQIRFGSSTAELYGQETSNSGTSGDPLHPFSVDEIERSGENTAELLSSGNMASSESNYMILSRDNPEQLALDVSAYERSGAAGGVQQGGLEDCWFQVSVAAFSTAPDGAEKISNMITQTDDGQYKVTFPGDPLRPVIVSNNEVDNNPDITDSAKWGRVLEAAILKRDPKSALPQERGGTGGNITDGLRLLTGKESTEIHIADSDLSSMSDTIQESLEDQRAIVASTPSSTDEPIEYRHAYSVSAYDPSSKTISLRNPWGYNEALPGTRQNGVLVGGAGEISMPLDIFMKNFHKIDIA